MAEHDQLLKRGQDSLRKRQTQRLLDIQKDNDRILTNLLKITQRTDKKPVQTVSQKAMMPNPPKVPQIKSLNHANRKNEILKILNENVKITGRLIFQDSKISKDKMSLDFKKHQQYSQRIRKVRMNSDKTFTMGHGGVKMARDMRVTSHTGYLPPLQPGFLSQRDGGISYRSSSAPKLQLSQMLMTDRTQRSPTRDANHNKQFSETHRPSVAKTEDVPQSTFISQLDIRNHSIPNLNMHNAHFEGGSATERVQGYQSDRYEVSPERGEAGPYTHRNYVTSQPVDAVEKEEIEEEQKEGDCVKEVGQTYEESQQEVQGLNVKTREEPDGEPSVDERQRTEGNGKEKNSEERKKTEGDERTQSSQERQKTGSKEDSRERRTEVKVQEESGVDIPEDNDLGDYSEDGL